MELLRMIWPWQTGHTLSSDGGGSVEVVDAGEWNGQRFVGARVVIGGEVHNGDIVVGVSDGGRPPVLQVVGSGGAPHIFGDDNVSFVPQVAPAVDAVTQMAWQMLGEGATTAGCAKHVRALPNPERVEFITRLQMERLERKCGELWAVHEEAEKNWNETTYVMLARAMGTTWNKEAFGELARRVRYAWVSRERNDREVVEALLLGASGLLESYDNDLYTRRLRTHFEHLRNKYSIVSMSVGAWKVSEHHPHGHPVLRIAQLASFLADGEFLFDKIVACRTVEDVQRLFRAEASPYWSTHYTPMRMSDPYTKRIGSSMANILGINLVVTLNFSYGKYLGDQRLCDAALELLEKIGYENNRIVNNWRAGGVPMESAFDSQAIIQLNNVYCLPGRCADCAVGRKVIGKVYNGD